MLGTSPQVALTPAGPGRRPSRTLGRLTRAARHPGEGIAVGWSLVRGWWYKLSYPARGIRFRAGRNFRVRGTLSVRGPGAVVMGDDVCVEGRVTPWTYAADAVIAIGSESYVNGTRFGCRREITIGARAILADARILDTDFHSTRVDRHDPAAPVRVAPVRIGENVWIAAAAGILPGTEIGANSVVGFGAVCAGRYPASVVIAGNPARVVRAVDS